MEESEADLVGEARLSGMEAAWAVFQGMAGGWRCRRRAGRTRR